jgi:AcrR family transcriptional regulator
VSLKLLDSRDPRVRRTRELLQNALLELIQEEGFDNVTVQRITTRAGVNRATFYKHYEDKWDLLRSWITATRQVLEDKAFSLQDPRTLEADSRFIPEIMVSILDHIKRNQPYYRLMIGRNPLTLISIQLEKQVEDFCREQLLLLGYKESSHTIPLTLLCREYACSFVGMVRWWLENDCSYSVEQMSKWVWLSSSQYPDQLQHR